MTSHKCSCFFAYTTGQKTRIAKSKHKRNKHQTLFYYVVYHFQVILKSALIYSERTVK